LNSGWERKERGNSTRWLGPKMGKIVEGRAGRWRGKKSKEDNRETRSETRVSKEDRNGEKLVRKEDGMR
jgi:hypothetical protein